MACITVVYPNIKVGKDNLARFCLFFFRKSVLIKIQKMKKLMILSAAAMALFLAMPQLAEATSTQYNISVNQEKAVKYQEITAETLPAPVTATLTKDYAGYTIEKVFLGDDGTYKVVVSKEAVKTILLFTNKGELIK